MLEFLQPDRRPRSLGGTWFMAYVPELVLCAQALRSRENNEDAEWDSDELEPTPRGGLQRCPPSSRLIGMRRPLFRKRASPGEIVYSKTDEASVNEASVKWPRSLRQNVTVTPSDGSRRESRHDGGRPRAVAGVYSEPCRARGDRIVSASCYAGC